MTPEQFCYWLNGFGELTTDSPTPEQWTAIKAHLETVFTKVTPGAPGYLLGPKPPREVVSEASAKVSQGVPLWAKPGDLDGALSALDAGLEQSKKDEQERRGRERLDAYMRYWRQRASEANSRCLNPYGRCSALVHAGRCDWSFGFGPSPFALTC